MAILFFCQSIVAQEKPIGSKKINPQYIARIDAGFLGGAELSRTFQVNNGVSLYNHFHATLGLGIERYYNDPYLPAVLDFRYNVLNRKTTPFVSASAGYLQPLVARTYYGKTEGGYTAGSKIGVTHFFAEHIGFETSLGYRYSRTSINSDVYPIWGPWGGLTPYPYEIENNMHRFELSIGLIFK